MQPKVPWWTFLCSVALVAIIAACSGQTGNLSGAAVQPEGAATPEGAAAGAVATWRIPGPTVAPPRPPLQIGADAEQTAAPESVSDTVPAGVVSDTMAAAQPLGPGPTRGIPLPTIMPKTLEATLSAQALRGVVSDPAYQAALEIVTEDGWTVDTKNAKVVTPSDRTPGEEIRFELKPKSGSRGRWKWLHYTVKGPGPKVYFSGALDTTTTGAPAPPAPGEGEAIGNTDAITTDTSAGAEAVDSGGAIGGDLPLGLTCRNPGPWTDWVSVSGDYCAPRFWCFGQAQLGTFRDQERKRQCRNGVQRQTKTYFVKCGC
jgi:hypothetical protein